MAKAWRRRGFRAAVYDIKLSTDTMDIVTERGFYHLVLLLLRLFLSLNGTKGLLDVRDCWFILEEYI